MRSPFLPGLLALLLGASPAVALAGSNASAQAWLSWSPSSVLSDLQTPGALNYLFVRVSGAAAFKGGELDLTWNPSGDGEGCATHVSTLYKTGTTCTYLNRGTTVPVVTADEPGHLHVAWANDQTATGCQAGGNVVVLGFEYDGCMDPRGCLRLDALLLLDENNAIDAADILGPLATVAGGADSCAALGETGAPLVAPIAPQIAAPGQTLTVTPAATGEGSLDWSGENLPEGAGVDPITGVLTWSAPSDAAGAYHAVTVVAEDAGGHRGSAGFTITVARPSTRDFTAAPHAPNQLLVRLRRGSVRLPLGASDAAVSEIDAAPEVQDLLLSTGASHLRKVFPSLGPADTVRTLASGEVVSVPDLSQIYLVEFGAAMDVPSMVALFEQHSSVLFAQPNLFYQADAAPSDSLFSNQWSLEQGSDEDIDATAAWDRQTGSARIKIGILDTGIDYRHEDLGAGFGPGFKIAGGYDYINGDTDPLDDNYHGTAVAGIAAALTNNTSGSRHPGIAGIAGGWGYDATSGTGNKGCQLLAIKTLNEVGSVHTDTLAQVIQEVADPAGAYACQILNLSAGIPNYYDEVLRAAVNFAARVRATLVASESNFGGNTPNYPADFDREWVIAVAGTTKLGTVASSYVHVDVAAPGDNPGSIWSTTPVQQTPYMQSQNIPPLYRGTFGGTSAAVPHVSGIAALLLSADSTLQAPDEVEFLIRAGAEQKPGVYDPVKFGAGRVNADSTLAHLSPPWQLFRYTSVGGQSVDSTQAYVATFLGPTLPEGDYTVVQDTVEATAYFPNYFDGVPKVWGRSVNASTGWSAASWDTFPNYESGYCEVVSSDARSARLRTYVYRVLDGPYAGWWPTPPAQVTFAYSVLGVLATVGVPESIDRSSLWIRSVPNPAKGSGALEIDLDRAGTVALRMLDTAGREVRAMPPAAFSPGRHRIVWTTDRAGGAAMPSGVYLIEATLSRDGRAVSTNHVRALLLR